MSDRLAALRARLAAERAALNALDPVVARIEARQVERVREERERQARVEDTRLKAQVERMRKKIGVQHETGSARSRRRSAAEEMRAWGLRDED